MNRSLLIAPLLGLLLGAGACKAKPPPANQDASEVSTGGSAGLPDLSTSLGAVRTEFNAHRGQARFLTLLAPT